MCCKSCAKISFTRLNWQAAITPIIIWSSPFQMDIPARKSESIKPSPSSKPKPNCRMLFSTLCVTRMSSTRQKNILHKQKYQTTNGFDGMGFPHLYNLYRFSENQLMYEVSLQFYYFCTNILSTCAINLLCKLRAGNGSFAYFKHVIANEGFSLFLMYYLSSGRTATDYRDSP